MTTANQALSLLREGNARFVSAIRSQLAADTSPARRVELAGGQEPFAIILGCSDSRVPAELVFDCGLGDLFVIRVAGNIVAPSQIGSVEFAAQQFGTRLVVVLGHSHCGAVAATIDQLRQPSAGRSKNLRSIVDRIRPAVEPLMGTDASQKYPDLSAEELLQRAIRANVRIAANQLRHGSEIIENLINENELEVVGAEYSLDSGVVDFFDVM